MHSFSLSKHPAMVLSPGAAKGVGDQVSATTGPASHVLLVVDPAVKELGLADGVMESIAAAGHDISVFDNLQSDPKESSVDEATELAHELEADCVVGLGGGSALDTSKLVAALGFEGENCAPYRLAASPLPFRKLGLIAMPTTAGTGSETTGVSVISGSEGTKYWFSGASLKPDMALMDPKLTVGLPAFWTFYTGMDALVHAIEARTNKYENIENNRLAEHAIVHAVSNLVTAVKEPENIEARTGMMVAAAYGGLAIGNVGCAVAHNIGHALGSLASIPHGRAVSVALANSLSWTLAGNEKAFDAVSELLGCSSRDGISDKLHQMADECSETLRLSSDEKSKFDAANLPDEMLNAANVAMLDSTARDYTRDDVEHLAALVMA